MYTFWDFPFLSNFQQLDFQGLPCFFFFTLGTSPFIFKDFLVFYILLGTSPFIFKDFLVCVHFLGLPIHIILLTTSFSRTSLLFIYFGDFPFHFQGLPCLCTLFGTSHFYQTFNNFIFKDFLVCICFGDFPFTINNFYISFSRTSLIFIYFGGFPFHFQGLPCCLHTLGTSPFIFKDFLVCVHLLGLPTSIKLSTTSFSRTSLFVYTLGTSLFLLKLQQFHLQGRPCFVYTLGTSHLQLTTSTLHFQGLPCFGTPLFNQIVVRTITIIIFAFLCRGQLST